MIGFTPAEFDQVREGIVAAHLYCQAINPLLKSRHMTLNKDQRVLSQLTPDAVAEAYKTIAAITHREGRDPESEDTRPPNKLDEIDSFAMRDELENVSALNLPDLVYQMLCALRELPMFIETNKLVAVSDDATGRLMAWSFEAGRRYGVQQAIAILETTTNEFKTGTDAVLTAALNSSLDLPSPELPFGSAAGDSNATLPATPAAVDDSAHLIHILDANTPSASSSEAQ